MDANLSLLDLAKSDIMQWMLVGGEVYVKPVPGTGRMGKQCSALSPSGGTGRSSGPGRRWPYHEHWHGGGKRPAAGNITRCWKSAPWTRQAISPLRTSCLKSSDRHSLGIRVSLTRLAQYEALPDRYTYPRPVGGLELAVLRVPLVNCVDGSADAVSIYEPAMQVIKT